MRVMTDSNIVVSAALFPNSNIAKIFDYTIENHKLILSKYTIDEVEKVFLEKFPYKLVVLKKPKIMKPKEYIEKYMR